MAAKLEPIFVDNIPAKNVTEHEGKILFQKPLMLEIIKSDFAVVFISRQVGKSVTGSSTFWWRVVNESKNGQLFIVLAPQENIIKSLLIDDILLEAFGGKEEAYDLNAVYVKTPENWLERQNKLWEKMPDHFDFWVEKGWITADKKYVKLFIEDLLTTGKGRTASHFMGKLFTGADILCAAANHNLGNTLRGRKIHGIYGEELGQWKQNQFGVYMPTIINNGGWVMYCGTPPEEDDSWVNTELLSPIIDSKTVTTKTAYGIDWYLAEDKREIPLSAIEIQAGKVVPDTFSYRQIVCIGDIEKIFPYVYKGEQKFAQVQANRKMPYVVNYIKDENDKLIPDGTGYYQYEVIPSGKPNSGIPTINEEQYRREYRMDRFASKDKVFKTFNRAINVIKDTEFNHTLYNSLAGYDHGVAKKIIGKEKDGVRSACAWAKIAVIPHGNHNQYVIYDCDYILPPNPEDIAYKWWELLNDCCPIISENAIWKKVVGNMSAFNEILKGHSELARSKLAFTGKGIFKCFKRGEIEKVNLVSSWFKQTQVNPNDKKSPYFTHPTDNKLKGRKIMMTNNCTEIINYFEHVEYRTDEHGQKYIKLTRDDIYDAATYAIDAYEYNEEYRKAIQKFWKENAGSENQLVSEMDMNKYYAQIGQNIVQGAYKSRW